MVSLRCLIFFFDNEFLSVVFAPSVVTECCWYINYAFWMAIFCSFWFRSSIT